MDKIRLNVLDFTENPGPRYIRQDTQGASTSGEAFYLQKLNKYFADALSNNQNLVLVLDGVSGYPSSFLDEAIGELVFDFKLSNVKNHLEFETQMFQRRVIQVKNETFLQWEQRRIKKDSVVHSPGVNVEIFYINNKGILEKKKIL